MHLTAMLGLAACIAAPPGSDPDACGASALQDFVGQPEAVIYATTFVGTIRVVRPGQPVTEDYSTSRTNFHLDERGRIASITCG
ncbi:MAG: I78 family peptidase inhibitor [Gemmobacter sp.]